MIHDVTRSQPKTCTTIQVALIQLLVSWGITPSVVLGLSSGEIAATFAAGLLSLAEAITAAYYRGYVVDRNTLRSEMMSASLSRENAETEIVHASIPQKASRSAEMCPRLILCLLNNSHEASLLGS
jgi:acyl transferase domain-containing protein